MDIFDRLHKTISISPLAKKIIDTPQFQRLRRIKQLGCANFVYPCATHTRFEHSIGVAYLGKKMIRHFQQNQPELNISDQQVELIFLGGLLHDIGHAPYSHAFEHLTQEKHEQWSQEITKNLTKKLLKPQEQQTLLNIITGDGSGWMFEIIANKI